MQKLTIKTNNNNVVIISSLNGNLNKLECVDNLLNTYKYVILNGNLFINNFYDISFKNNIFYCVGDLDLINLKNNYSFINKMFNYPFLIELKFNYQSFFICNGGASKEIINCPFINFIDNKPWHEKYNGSLGYFITNNPISLEEPKFYNYSCRIGHKNKIYAQEVGKYGLNKTFEI